MTTFTNDQMDEAILKYRRMTKEQFYNELERSPEFKAVIEAAYKRADFMHTDAEGWTPLMFNRPTAPARPNERDLFGPGANLLRKT